MAGDLSDLSLFCSLLPARIEQAASEIAKDVAYAIGSDLVEVTPVDQGFAMSNWQAGLGQSFIDTVEPAVPSPRGYWASHPQAPPLGTSTNWTHRVDPDLTHQANVGPAKDAIRAVLDQKAPGEMITLVNNLPYIQELDGGSSEQQPAGFVDRALILGGNLAKRATLEL